MLTIPKPYENHNGGMLQFGTDGKLYASVGDGDPGVLNMAGAFAQRLDVLLGRLIRIDPRRGDPFAVPTDNPFVNSPERPTGDLGIRPPEPVALLDRSRDGRPVRARRREHVAGGDQRPSERRPRRELRLALLRGNARLRRERNVRAGGRATRRLPPRGRRVRGHRGRRRAGQAHPGAGRSGTSTAISARAE